jgi:hypothetical protein
MAKVVDADECLELVEEPESRVRRSEQPVDVSVSLPKLGAFKTKVSQKTANDVTIFTFGGLVALLGVVVAIMFGVRPSGKA